MADTTTCDKCGKELHIGDWAFCPHPGGVSLVTEKCYPFVTKNFNGQPIEVTSRAHEKALCQEYGVVKRDDVAWNEKSYEGYDPRTNKQVYKEANGVGMPGCWV
jgi:hypothetical protein